MKNPTLAQIYLPALGKPESDDRIWRDIGSNGENLTDLTTEHYIDFEDGAVVMNFVVADNGQSYCDAVEFNFDASGEGPNYTGYLPMGIGHQITAEHLESLFGKPFDVVHNPEKTVPEFDDDNPESNTFVTVPETDFLSFRISEHLTLAASFSNEKPQNLTFDLEALANQLWGRNNDGSYPDTLANKFRNRKKGRRSILPAKDFNPFEGTDFRSLGLFS
ncbi:MAG: hypothetical protein JKY31_06265 [Rhodobacteraceae bacterium]|nr:hypothetical protein [Paracoccaceae bacterium]